MPDVAVIIPTYNRAALLPAALDSVVAQTTRAKIEVCVIDDGSTDDTTAVIGPYLDRHGDPAEKVTIRYIRQNKQGVVAARNTGIEKTTAPLVAFLDSDDYWDARKLELQIKGLEQDPENGVAHTSFRYVDDRGRFCDDGPNRVDNPCVGRCTDVLLNEFLVLFSSVLIRRGVIERAAAGEEHGKAFDPRWTNSQDYDLILRASRLCKFVYVPEPVTLYRLHGGHGAMGNLKRAFGFHCRVQMDFVKRYGQELGIDDEEIRSRVAAFLFGRAESAFWRRELATSRDLCDLARELGVWERERRFGELERKASRPAWIYQMKDGFDRVFGLQAQSPKK